MRKIRRNHLRKRTFQHIEQEIFDYKQTMQSITDREEDAIFGRAEVTNPEGSRGSLPGRPTESKALELDKDKVLQEMRDIADAIDTIFSQCDKRHQDFIRLFYWTKPQTLTVDGIAMRLYISRREVFNFRHRICEWVARELGWW